MGLLARFGLASALCLPRRQEPQTYRRGETKSLPPWCAQWLGVDYVPFRKCVSKRKRETLPLPSSQERQTNHSGHTSHYHHLQGTRGCAMARPMSRFANALANANARRSTYFAPRSVKLTTVVTLVTTTTFKVLEGAQWLGLCPVSLMR